MREEGERRRFEEFGEADYAAWLGSLDLATDQLMSWSLATGIPLVALQKGSDFFYFNAHLLANAGGAGLSYAELQDLSSAFNLTTSQVELADGSGTSLPTLTLQPGVIRRIATTKGISHTSGFAVDGLSLEALQDYLALPTTVPHRTEVGDGLRALPLSMVKALRGKGLFLSLTAGRSYAAAGPNS